MIRSYSFKSTVKIALWVMVALGVLLRLYRITANEFLFYDEGMYLGYNRSFLNLVAANPPRNIQELLIISGIMFKTALGTAKALWFFILNLRVFITGLESWYFARIISAGAGLATIVLTYMWAKRYFQCKQTALLSAAVLAVLPSHVFYSRLGMQEALSALLFLSGMYLYVFSPRGLTLRMIASTVILSAVFFTNYRMIIAPVFVILAQVWMDYINRQNLDGQKLIWFLVVFAGIVFGIGGLYGGVNTYVTFGWMFHQADESQAHRHLINFFSFPYYLFTLDHMLFGAFFFSNVYFVYKRRWEEGVLPFLFVLLQMFLFSFAAEKGARYLCVVLPFVAMAVAHVIMSIERLSFPNASPSYRGLPLVVIGNPEKGKTGPPIRIFGGDSVMVCSRIMTAFMLIGLLWQSFNLARATTDYGKAVAMVLAHDPQAKIISTQPLVESLFVPDESRIADCPKDPAGFAALLNQGYRYLIIDPQVYVSWTADQQRFTPALIEFLEMIRYRVPPVAVLPHIDGVLLKRFVLDHNQDLFNSLKFLKEAKGKGAIYIYDLH